jgi:hypothetical protein
MLSVFVYITAIAALQRKIYRASVTTDTANIAERWRLYDNAG